MQLVGKCSLQLEHLWLNIAQQSHLPLHICMIWQQAHCCTVVCDSGADATNAGMQVAHPLGLGAHRMQKNFLLLHLGICS